MIKCIKVTNIDFALNKEDLLEDDCCYLPSKLIFFSLNIDEDYTDEEIKQLIFTTVRIITSYSIRSCNYYIT